MTENSIRFGSPLPQLGVGKGNGDRDDKGGSQEGQKAERMGNTKWRWDLSSGGFPLTRSSSATQDTQNTDSALPLLLLILLREFRRL